MKFKKYYGILVEEISDRVVVNVLDGVQEEISGGGPVIDNIINEVIRPKQDILVEWISHRLRKALENDVLVKKEEIENYVRNLIADSFGKNTELKTIEQVPFMGKMITQTIENSISQIINDIINKALEDMASYRNRDLVNDTTSILLNTFQYKDEKNQLNDVFKDISIEIIDVVKKQVQIKKWKLKEESEKDLDESEQKGVEFLMVDKA